MKMYKVLLLLIVLVSCVKQFNLQKGIYINETGNAIFLHEDSITIFNPVPDAYYFDKQKKEFISNSSAFGCFIQSKNIKVNFEQNSKKCFKIHNPDTCLQKDSYFQSSFCFFEISKPIQWDSINIKFDSIFNADISIYKDKLQVLEINNSYIRLESEIHLLFSNKLDKQLSSKSSLPISAWDIYSNGILIQKKEVMNLPHYLVGLRSIMFKNFKTKLE